MESNEIIREQIFEIIKNQIESNTPPETKQTLKRLLDSGYNDNDRYVSNLKKLSEEPFDD